MEALNKKLALVLWSEDENGEEDVAVFSGILVSRDGVYFLERCDSKNPEILAEWLERIRPVSEDLKETLLGCDYQLALSVGKVKGGQSMESFGGLKWPE